MKLARIIKNYNIPGERDSESVPDNHPGILRQTPGCKGIWGDVRFTCDARTPSDYTIVLNHPLADTSISCPKEHVWAVIQEPPIKELMWLHKGDVSYRYIYTSCDTLRTNRYIPSQPAIPWEVDKGYDFLSTCALPPKAEKLSWVTSNKGIYRGHKRRLAFLEFIREKIDVHLYGRGFSYIQDKWDGLAPYKYSLAIENFSNPYYWSEKLADCFLAWTMPIYYGCSRINEYFPPESLMCIDIDDPDVIRKILSIVESDAWERNRQAIAKARELVLQKYQLFPFIAEKIQLHETRCRCNRRDSTNILIPRKPRARLSLKERILNNLKLH